MAEVTPAIFIGGWSAARDNYSKFEVIANVACDAPNFCGARQFPLVDGPGNSRELMREAIAYVAEAIRAERKTLVHCVGGRSRSVVVLAAAMLEVFGTPVAETIARMRVLRPTMEPNQPHVALLELLQCKPSA